VEVLQNHFNIWHARKGKAAAIFYFCHHSWSSAPSPWWTSTRWRPLPIPLATRGRLRGRLLPAQSETVTMGRWSHGCHNSGARELAPAYRGYDRFSTGGNGHRCHVASGTPAAQQPTSVRSIALSDRAVVSRRRPARHHCHQHTTSREAASATGAAVARLVSSMHAIRGTSNPSAAKCTPADAASHIDGKLHDDGAQGGNQPPTWWGR
jgi:hypothetical protein